MDSKESLTSPPPFGKTVKPPVELADSEENMTNFLSLMTPSSSGCGVRFLEPMFPTPIPYPYLTPTPVKEHLQGQREIVDILGEFFSFGPLEMAQKILTYLEPADLLM